jgi:phosphomannomutase
VNIFKYKKRIEPIMEEFMEKLKQKVTVGLVGGSDLPKILEQLGGETGCFI